MDGEGVQRPFLFKMHTVGFYKVLSWGFEYSEDVGRKTITLTRITQGKTFFSGYRGLLGRQQLMQDYGGASDAVRAPCGRRANSWPNMRRDD